jgi:FlaA1/EpsC-like NDP-sugar epimerase
VAVRFGNVLGSNGSVLPRFMDQIKAGGPVTVTHPEVRRYFMLIPEAVHLVLQAAALAEQGAVYVLEMGEQIKVVDLARNLIQLSGFVPDDEIPIKFVGLRPGEKLFEELVGPEETAEPAPVNKIVRVTSTHARATQELARAIADLEEAAQRCDSRRVLDGLSDLIPAFQSDHPEAVTAVHSGRPSTAAETRHSGSDAPVFPSWSMVKSADGIAGT